MKLPFTFSKKRVPTSRKEFRVRSWLIVAVIGALFLVVAGNLARIMIINGDYYKGKAEQNQLQDKEISANRGTIYDTNGMVVAQSVSAWRIYATPNKIPEAERPRITEFLCRTMSEAMPDITYEEFEKIFTDTGKSYLDIRKRGSDEEKTAVSAVLNEFIEYKPGVDEDGNLSDAVEKFYIKNVVGIDPDVKRIYPYGSLAAGVIGLTNDDDKGYLGVELEYDDMLSGTSGRLISAKNGRNITMGDEFEAMYDAVQGTGIGLTLDMNIQRLVEEELWDVYEDSGGVGAYGVVMNVNTGAILAMANVPGFDANNPYALNEDQLAEIELMKAEDYDDEEAFEAAVKQAKSDYRNSNWRNFTVSDSYEPGSVFKTITTSAGLESGKITMGTDCNCIGYAKVATETISCNKTEGHGYQTLREGLKNSCNPFFIHCGQLIGAETFFNFFEAFGFTEKTGVDLPAEPVPKAGVTYHPYEDLHIVELSSSAFGQSFQVTPLQMITAISAIANGGNLMKPYIVAKTFDEDGNVLSVTQPEIRRQVISKETASLVADMMEGVVSSGTGKNAYVAGYRVAGKTGTSQKLSIKGDKHKHYLASFACFAPVNDPEIAVLVVVDEPKGQINGGQICTPVAAKIVESTLEYMNVERQYTDKELEKLAVATPEVLGEKTDRARQILDEAGFTVRIMGDGDYITDQVPSAGSTIPRNGVVVIYSGSDSEKLMTTVPDLGGLSISQATSKATSEGLNITISGNSSINSSELVSYDQSISEGEEVEYGTTITVYFKSNSGVSDYSE